MPKSVFSSLNGQKLELKVKKWEAEMRDSETLKISVLSCSLPFIIKIREILALYFDDFKHHCKIFVMQINSAQRKQLENEQ